MPQPPPLVRMWPPFVASRTSERRPSSSSSPAMSRSFSPWAWAPSSSPGPYASAVSNRRTPASTAARTVAASCSRGGAPTWSKVIRPSPIAPTRSRPTVSLPISRIFITACPSQGAHRTREPPMDAFGPHGRRRHRCSAVVVLAERVAVAVLGAVVRVLGGEDGYEAHRRHMAALVLSGDDDVARAGDHLRRTRAAHRVARGGHRRLMGRGAVRDVHTRAGRGDRAADRPLPRALDPGHVRLDRLLHAELRVRAVLEHLTLERVRVLRVADDRPTVLIIIERVVLVAPADPPRVIDRRIVSAEPPPRGGLRQVTVRPLVPPLAAPVRRIG